jgi:hypothetical protein
MEVTVAFALASGLLLLANLGIFALNLKLYTEMFKEQAQRDRSQRR